MSARDEFPLGRVDHPVEYTMDPGMWKEMCDELDKLRAATPRSNFHQPTHMKGWEAFGVVAGNVMPLVRRLGVGHHTSKPTYGTEPWGPGATRNGIGSIEIHQYADTPTGGYIYVAGTTEQGVTKAWGRARDALVALNGSLWGAS